MLWLLNYSGTELELLGNLDSDTSKLVTAFGDEMFADNFYQHKRSAKNCHQLCGIYNIKFMLSLWKCFQLQCNPTNELLSYFTETYRCKLNISENHLLWNVSVCLNLSNWIQGELYQASERIISKSLSLVSDNNCVHSRIFERYFLRRSI